MRGAWASRERREGEGSPRVQRRLEGEKEQKSLQVLWHAVAAEAEKNEKVRSFLQDIAGTLAELQRDLTRPRFRPRCTGARTTKSR